MDFTKSNSQSSIRSLFVGCLADILTSVKPRDARTASGPTCSRDLEAKSQSHSLQSTVLYRPTLPNHRQLPLWAPSRVDGIAVHEGTAHPQRVDVAVCLKQCSGVQNECMPVDIVEQQVTMLLGIILRQIWRWGILDSLCEGLTKAKDLAKSLANVDFPEQALPRMTRILRTA